jgi:twitching motility protein PilI
MGRERLRLHTFQTALSERMKAARDDERTRTQKLAVTMGQALYLLDLGEVAEIMKPGSMTPVPLTHDWYLGLVSVRGNLTGVVDYMALTSGVMQQRTPACRIVVPRSSLPVACGLLVSRVIGIVDVAQIQLRASVSPEEGGMPAGIKQHYQDKDGQRWLELNLAALMADKQFLQVAI